MSVRESYIARIRAFQWESLQTTYMTYFVPLGNAQDFEKLAREQWNKQISKTGSLDDDETKQPVSTPSNLIGVDCAKVLVVLQKPIQATYIFDTDKELTDYEAANKLKVPLVVGKEIARAFNRAEWANPLTDQESQDLLQVYLGLSESKEELKEKLEFQKIQLERAYEAKCQELEERFKVW